MAKRNGNEGDLALQERLVQEFLQGDGQQQGPVDPGAEPTTTAHVPEPQVQEPAQTPTETARNPVEEDAYTRDLTMEVRVETEARRQREEVEYALIMEKIMRHDQEIAKLQEERIDLLRVAASIKASIQSLGG